MVWCLEKAYQDALTRLLKIASNENTISAKLIYREAAEITEAVDDDRGKFSEIRVEILRKLVSIYHNEGNLPIVESILEQICRLKGARKASCDSQVTADLAACFRATAAEMSRVLREIRLEVKPPLHLNPDVPFPSTHRALRGGHDEVTRLLCETAEPLTDRDMLKQNALIVAAAYGKTELLEPAFRSEPSLLTDRDVLDRSALFHAAHNGELESFLRLVDAGACIKDRDASSQSILRVAAAAGSTAIVHWLLTQGLSPNDDHFQISSPLHEAARRGHGDVCKLLLDHGAWANCRQHEGGKTPAGVASECGFPLISTMIEEATLRPLNDIWSQESRQAYEADQDYGHQPTSQVQAVPIPCGAIPGIGSTTPVLPIGPQAPVAPHAPGSGRLLSSSHYPGRIDDGLFPSSASDTTPDLSMWSDVGIPSSPPMAVPNVQPKDSEDVS
jgi:ankyrin repeat protein